MISTHSRSFRSRISRQGFSLIEVAIALVIFVIGALAIIRIFPGALSVIGNNGDQQLATNINRSTLARLKSEKAVPDAIFNNSNLDETLSFRSWTDGSASADHTGDFRYSESSVIGIPRFNRALPTTQEIETGESESALSRYRAIVGEKAAITPLTIAGSSNSYALTQFPVSVQPQGAVLLPVKPVVSQDYTLNDVRTQPNGTLDFSRYRLEDSDDITSTEGVAAGSLLYVTYRYKNSDDVTWGITEEAVPIPGAITPLRTVTTLKVNPPTGTGRRDAARNTGGIVIDAVIPEVVAVRLRQYVGQGTFGVTGASPLAQVADARRGLVGLPTGIVTTRPVVLDYVADWSFLLQDGTPSISPNDKDVLPALTDPDERYRQLALGAPFIDDRLPVGVYSLLIESGTAYPSLYGEEQPDPPAADKLVRPDKNEAREDDMRGGKVTFIVENSASRARVAYQTRDSWTQQLAVAARAYKPYAEAGVPGPAEPWRDYYLGNDNFLYFHAGEAGKTISISYRTTDATGPLVDRPFVIESMWVGAASAGVPAGFTAGTNQVARVNLTDARGEPLTSAGAPQLVSIQAVKGISVTSRTAYINGSKFAQTLLTSNRGANS